MNKDINAIDVVRQMVADGQVSQEVAEKYFPELKERDDEKLREQVVYAINQLHVCECTKNKLLAWLEKQSELVNSLSKGLDNAHERIDRLIQKNISLIEQLEKKQSGQKEINLVDILKHYPIETKLFSPLYGKLWLAEIDEKNKIITCYKYPLNEGCKRAILEQEDTVSFYSDGTTGLPDFSISKDCMLFLYEPLKDKMQPKQEWSEKDEKMFNRCIKTMKGAYYLDGEALYWFENRFKSLKLQNTITNEELAQAKKDAYNDALNKIEYHSDEPTFDDGWSAAIDYIRKKSITSQATWEPSDKQMNILEQWLKDNQYKGDARYCYHIFESLYQDLKKLRKD